MRQSNKRREKEGGGGRGGEGAFAVFRAKGPRTVPSSVLQELITVSRHSAVTRGKLWELIVITGGVIKLS